MRIKIFALLLNVLSTYNCAFGQTIPRFEYSDSSIIELPKNQNIEFGYLIVLENRARPKGRTLRLPVFILKSRSLKPKRDPILYTSGGPGSSSVSTAKYGEYFDYLDERDFIVFEQRGTRYAQPNLGCTELDSIKKSNSWINLSETEKSAIEVKAALRCQRRLLASGNNLSAYNTKASAEDIEDLRKVLRIKQFNLLSVSYSTKIAQVLLRDYPKSIRSAVLDSPLPLWADYDETSLKFFNEKLHLLFSSCASDSNCNKVYPNLKNRFLQFIEATNKHPILLPLKSPIDSSRIYVSLKGYQIASFIGLGNTWRLSELPKFLDKLCNGAYNVLEPFVYDLFSDNNRSMGMRLSVWCSEEYPFENLSKEVKQKDIPAQFYSMTTDAVPIEICKIWKVEKAKPIENKLFKTKVPVLLINGEFDPDTPAFWGEQLHKEFAKSYHFVLKGMSHTPTQNWDNNCGMKLANTFFNDPFTRPTPECLEGLKPLQFDTAK
jgi:pimeloyl-ACP methyl ester carboxylesterase